MNDRRRAIAILTEARDELARRLIERVVDASVDVLDEARGESYGSEIDAIQDSLGARLASVTSMLAQIQTLPDSPGESTTDILGVTTDGVTFDVPLPTTTVIAETAAPTMASVAEPITVEPPAVATPSFIEFLRAVRAGDTSAAAEVLATLLELDTARALRCTERFNEQFHATPEFLPRAMALRRELAAGGVNGALMLLWECFGLQGPEAVAALSVLRERMSAPPTGAA